MHELGLAAATPNEERDGLNAQKLEALLQAIPSIVFPEVPESQRLKVHATVSRVAVLYEKIRTAVDYKDEHLVRKAAIERILKRQLFLKRETRAVAESLLHELIAAGYLPNATLPESIVPEVAEIIEKSRRLQKTKVLNEAQVAWIQSLVAVEIEEHVAGTREQRLLTQFLCENLQEKIRFPQVVSEESEQRLQIFIACYRSLWNADEGALAYALLPSFYPQWFESGTWLDDRAVAWQMAGVEMTLKRALRHPAGIKFAGAVKPWAVALRLLRQVVKAKPEEARKIIMSRPQRNEELERLAVRSYEEARVRLRRGTWRAMLYLFMTKIVFALALEVPVEWYLYQAIHRLSLGINIAFPPVVMLLVGLLIRLPGKGNTKRLLLAAEEILSTIGPPEEAIKSFRPSEPKRKFAFSVLYFLLFVVIFGGVWTGLSALGFSWVSAIIFVFFLTLVSFFGFRLRLAARATVVVERSDGVLQVLVDVVSLPILRVGQWLSRSISRLNVFLFVMDFIIEAPFKSLLNILEGLFLFIREKKEELQ